MVNGRKHLSGTELKIFDPRDASTASGGVELVDPTVAMRNEQWWMYLAGQASRGAPTDIYSAVLPAKAPLAKHIWQPNRNPAGELIPVSGRHLSACWDGRGGRHCPSYVKGWDPHQATWAERIYYAGAKENLWGPYAIGFLQWDGAKWRDQPEPVFVAHEEWERGSVYEPNLIYHDGKWKMWYVAGSNQENDLVHGYTESEDGCTEWNKHKVFAPPEMKMFDFCVRQRGDQFDAVFSRVWTGATAPPPETGMWWCRSRAPSCSLRGWSEPVQIMTAEDCGWHSGPWKPSFHFEGSADHAFIFFDGVYRTNDPGPFPFTFTVGCLEIDLPSENSG
ncbi:MAG: hypothetical protein JO356_15615 [Acidobacteria bacterium]|nr:hypothetical protein [Acidobacteriota bacterium]